MHVVCLLYWLLKFTTFSHSHAFINGWQGLFGSLRVWDFHYIGHSKPMNNTTTFPRALWVCVCTVRQSVGCQTEKGVEWKYSDTALMVFSYINLNTDRDRIPAQELSHRLLHSVQSKLGKNKLIFYLFDGWEELRYTIGDYTSEWTKMTCGVPQGSILGPLFVQHLRAHRQKLNMSQ